jgi:hypothetical protein
VHPRAITQERDPNPSRCGRAPWHRILRVKDDHPSLNGLQARQVQGSLGWWHTLADDPEPDIAHP